MENKKTIFIINPNANMGQAWRQAADLRPIMQELGDADWAGSVYPTHAIELTKKAVQDGYELIIAGGGDGTVHEVVNALMTFPKEKRPTLGVVPLGSGNDFSFSMGMETEPWKALLVVKRNGLILEKSRMRPGEKNILIMPSGLDLMQ